NEPVTAVAPSALYKFQKFARRKKAALTVVSSFVALLLSGIILSTVLAVRASKASAEARIARDRARNALTRSQLEVAENLFPFDASKALATLARLVCDEPTNRVVSERLLNALASRSFRVPVLPPFPKGVTMARCSGDGQRFAMAIMAGKASSLQVYSRE